ncbi:MAG: calcineurin-like phosphoesterase family protein [Salinivirgaceae bacterium]|jgi:predicted MPP superfamily phosphohydrolase|nr:calcineurin-like phosphoesterase family protein [Salinivirgaceae bacterium]
MNRIIIILSISFISTAILAQRKSVSGFVFNDINNNEVYDKTDIPLSSIAVSSLQTIVQTDENGYFEIPVLVHDIISVIKPKGYEFTLQDNNVPKFYQLYYQKPIKENLFYEGVKIEKKLPDTLFFALHKKEVKQIFKTHVIGDIQAPGLAEVKYFRELIVPGLLKNPADFAVCLGDIADNQLDLYADIENSLEPLNIPIYMVPGNHDMNYRAKDFEHQVETYRKHFGPDYYSFNYANTHYIALNNVIYHGWDKKNDQQGFYDGGLHEMQLNWLQEDLKLVPIDMRIVLMAHIPFLKNFCDSVNLVEIFSLLEGREDILGLYGHVHSIESWKYSNDDLMKGKGHFQGHIAGSACGGWWVSPFGLDSLPDATSYDGSPAGTFLYEFSNEEYSKRFIPGGKASDFQLRISNPLIEVLKDSIETRFIYVNIFDGDEETKVHYTIDNGESYKLTRVDEPDPFVARNQYRRFNRDGWTPRLVDCNHLWKASYPKNIELGMHKIEVQCILSNGKGYSDVKIFEVVK